MEKKKFIINRHLILRRSSYSQTQETHVKYCEKDSHNMSFIVKGLHYNKMEKQEKEWKEFKEDLIGSMELKYKELIRILSTKTKYVEKKTMDKCLKHIRNIIHSHKVLMRESPSIKVRTLEVRNEVF